MILSADIQEDVHSIVRFTSTKTFRGFHRMFKEDNIGPKSFNFTMSNENGVAEFAIPTLIQVNSNSEKYPEVSCEDCTYQVYASMMDVSEAEGLIAVPHELHNRFKTHI